MNLQLILSGDFFQLPPVPSRTGGKQQPSIFAFEAQTWTRCIGQPVFLTHVFRQREQCTVILISIGYIHPVEKRAF